jgi:hypothetical protein
LAPRVERGRGGSVARHPIGSKARLAIATRGERLVTVLGDEQAPETDRLRKATNHFVRHLKEEVTAWEDKYMRASGKQ